MKYLRQTNEIRTARNRFVCCSKIIDCVDIEYFKKYDGNDGNVIYRLSLIALKFGAQIYILDQHLRSGHNLNTHIYFDTDSIHFLFK